MSLQQEIEEKASKIFRDSYQMSIGELLNLYRDGELDIHPEFQRVFRWNDFQKTKLIESIMLNIPIPPIFVSQNEKGVWDVVDGVQRLSTIFQFVGLLKNEEGKKIENLKLLPTDYLPSFDSVQWKTENEKESFTAEQRLFFKRSRIDVNIVKKESDPNTKYELFQRLNTGGSFLSDQEVRSCLMIMTNHDYYNFIVKLSKNPDFNNTVPITDRKIDEQYLLELILRLLVPAVLDDNKINAYQEISDLLDKMTIKLCKENSNKGEIEEAFSKTFKLLNETEGEGVFKTFKDGRHSGPFLTAAYQGIAYGVFCNISNIGKLSNNKKWLSEKISNFYKEDTFTKNMKPGTKSVPRFKDLSNFGKEFFRP